MTSARAVSASDIPQDQKQRTQALDVTRSFIVTAPAGSGKTQILVQRILKLLCVCDNPEDILAVTFTRKAAAQMHARIMHLLIQAKERKTPKNTYEKELLDLAHVVLEHDRKQGWRLLDAPKRLQISTLDGFFRSICQKLPMHSAHAARAEIISDVELKSVMHEAVHTLFLDMESDRNLANDVEKIMLPTGASWAEIETTFVDMLNKRNQWLPRLQSFAGSAGRDKALRAFKQERQDLARYMLAPARNLLKPFLKALLGLATTAADNLKGVSKKNPNSSNIIKLSEFSDYPENDITAQLQFWTGVRSFLLTKGGWRKSGGINIKLGFVAKSEEKDQMQELLGQLAEYDAQIIDRTRYTPDTTNTEVEFDYLFALARCLCRASDALNHIFATRQRIDYPGITLSALQALKSVKDPTRITHYLGHNIRHILIDEFQDTSAEQLELINWLTLSWGNPQKTQQSPNTLFFVGDPLQSCYLFRGGDMRLFLSIRKRGLPSLENFPNNISLTDLRLTSNFRSASALVDWSNQCFDNVLCAEEDLSRGSTPFVHSTAMRQLDGKSMVRARIVLYNTKDEQSNARETEGELVSSWVVDALAQTKGDIAILVAQRNALRWVLPALSAHDLKWHAPKVRTLGDSIVVRDLCVLTRLLIDVNDRIAWLGLLRSPWCGVSYATLHAVANAGAHIWDVLRRVDELGIPDSECQRLIRARNILADTFKLRDRCSLRRWVEGAWLALGGPVALTDDTDLLNAYAYLDLLESKQLADNFSVAMLEEQVKQLYALSGDATSRLKIMTVHQAKGLEFETVILTGLDQGGAKDRPDLVRWEDYEIVADAHKPQQITAPRRFVLRDNPVYQWLKDVAKQKKHLEQQRLLYIGATRAIRRLYMSGCMAGEHSEESGKLVPKIDDEKQGSSHIAQLYAATKQSFACEHYEDILKDLPAPASAQPIKAQQAHIVSLPGNWSASLPREHSDQNAEDTPTSSFSHATPRVFNAHAYLQKQIGITAHKALQDIANAGVEQWSAKQIRAQMDNWRAYLRQQGVPQDALDDCAQEVCMHLERTLNDKEGCWVLKAHPDAANELRILSKHADSKQTSLLIVDRTFVVNNERWIVDYKTSCRRAEESQESFIQRQEKEHCMQLATYADALARLGDEKIRTALYFTALPKLHEYQL